MKILGCGIQIIISVLSIPNILLGGTATVVAPPEVAKSSSCFMNNTTRHHKVA